MYRVLAATGDLLQKQNILLPAAATALSDVQSEARLPEMQ
jgi:adhesin transport system outer membrane protein